MRSSAILIPTKFILAVILIGGVAGPVAAQSTSHAGDIPQSLRVEHAGTLEQLGALARHGPVGVEAHKALQREEEFNRRRDVVAPLADGKVSPDMNGRSPWPTA
jgi:hypothetical protein